MDMKVAGEDEIGFVALFGDKCDKNTPVYIGWGSRDGHGITRLQKHLRKQSPHIETLDVCAGSMEDAVGLRANVLPILDWPRRMVLAHTGDRGISLRAEQTRCRRAQRPR
jgi:hypothetical protein